MDHFDKASELEALARDNAIAFQRNKVIQGESLSHCENCGNHIPQARRAAITGVKTCVDCQTFNEKQGKLYGAR